MQQRSLINPFLAVGLFVDLGLDKRPSALQQEAQEVVSKLNDALQTTFPGRVRFTQPIVYGTALTEIVSDVSNN